MGRKPPCRICRSRRWKKNSIGFYVCEFGHQMEGYQEEEGEFDATMGGVKYRNLKSKRKKKEKKQSEILHGQEATDILLQAFQLLLRKQVYTLIHTMGFPPELEQVAREYWTLYLTHYAHLARPLPRRFRRKDNNQEITTSTMINKGVGAHDKSESMQDPDQEREEDQKQSSSDADSNATSTSESSDSEVDDSDNSSSESSDDDAIETDALSEDEEQGRAKPGSRKSVPDFTGMVEPTTIQPPTRGARGPNYLQKLKVDYTLAICYLACHHLRQPVLFADFYKWVATGDLPLYQASTFVPAKMLSKFSSDLHFVFLPRKQQSPNRLARVVHRLSLFYERQFQIVQPLPNIPPLTFRFVQELMLPVEIYPCAIRLCHIFFDMRSNNVQYDLATYGPSYVMGVVIMLAKLFIGLDGRQRPESNALDYMNTIPKEKDWIKFMDIRQSLRLKHETPLFVGEYENYRDLNPRGYKEMAARWMVKDSKAESYSALLNIIRRAVPALTNSKRSEPPCPDLQAFLRRLFAAVRPPSTPKTNPATSTAHDRSALTMAMEIDGSRQQPRPLRPGENYVHYTHTPIFAQDRGAFLGNYERVLGHAANTVGISREEMHKAVTAVEQPLLKWWAKISTS